MAKPTPSRLADSYQTYPTPGATASAALRGIDTKKYERGGGILYNKEQDVYAATDPVGQSDGSHFAAAVSVPPGWTLHSTYHSHPSGKRSTQFSEDDINTAQQLKVPSYVLAYDDNKVRIFDPATSKTSKDDFGDKMSTARVSNGSVVDETPPKNAAPSVATASPPVPTTPAPATTVPVAGSRITMKDFVAHHRAQTTKYKHKIVNVIK
jgi:hypothetical protein